jgi:S1-C subfamily serine protease
MPDWGAIAPQQDEPPTNRNHRKALAALMAATLVAGGLGAGLGIAFSGGGSGGGDGGGTNALSAAATPITPTKALSVAAIYKLVSPAVVDINTAVATPSSAGGSSQAAGTGMIVSSNGLILTNNHVIKDATKISVSIAGRSTSYPATVVGTSLTHDIALIKVNGLSALPTVALGNSSTVQVGDTAVAVGNAQGLGGSPSAASGSISAIGRTITANGGFSETPEVLHNLIETNAQIQPGDSGGPLLNSKGQVIGIDTAASSADATPSSLGFAIPINQAKSIALAIEQGTVTSSNGVHVGLSPFLGVYTGSQSSNPFGNFSIGGATSACSLTAAPTAGASISDVISGGPAARAGIVGGDTITSINGKQIASWQALTSAVGSMKIGTKVALGYADSCGSAHSTTLTIGGIPA